MFSDVLATWHFWPDGVKIINEQSRGHQNPQESSSRDHDNLRHKTAAAVGVTAVYSLLHHLWGPIHFLERPSASTLSITKKKKKKKSDKCIKESQNTSCLYHLALPLHVVSSHQGEVCPDSCWDGGVGQSLRATWPPKLSELSWDDYLLAS